MQTNILWSGIEYYSLENCLIDISASGIAVNSCIVGLYKKTLYRVEYTLALDNFWQTKSCLIKSQLDNEHKTIELQKKAEGWLLNGKIQPEFNGCTDVDIPLTPLTNSLPINRLKLNPGEQKKVAIIYIDLLEHTIKPVNQKYQRISEDTYNYENIPNDFEAEIKVDDAGFVIEYPQLFKRKMRAESSYPPRAKP